MKVVMNKMEIKIRFEKEKKKMLMLIGIGIVLAILFSIYRVMHIHMNNGSFGLESVFIIVAIILYPIGVVYGWNSIIYLYKRTMGSDKLLVGATATTAFSILIIEVAAAIITICFGWILGVYKAIVTLTELKRNIKG